MLRQLSDSIQIIQQTTDCAALAKKSIIKANLTTYVWAYPNNLCAVKSLLAKGPVFGAIYVNPTGPLTSYKSGVVTDPSTNDPNHAIVIVGYATINGINSFKSKFRLGLLS